MHGSITNWRRQQKRSFRRRAARIKDADHRRRYDIVLHAAGGRSHRPIAEGLHCSLSSVARTLRRFAECGKAGLVDRREESGHPKVTETYVNVLIVVVAHRPQDCGYRRTTWTLELLVDCLKDITGVEISTTTMGRLLKSLGIRRGRPPETAATLGDKPMSPERCQNRARLFTLPRSSAALKPRSRHDDRAGEHQSS